MIKKRNKRLIYSTGQKNFNTFKEMKTFIWYNSHTNEETQGFELINDVIQKHYIFIKKERRLLCIKIYDKEKEYKEKCELLQLKLFENGQKKDYLRDYQNHLYRDYQYYGSSNSSKLYNVTQRE